MLYEISKHGLKMFPISLHTNSVSSLGSYELSLKCKNIHPKYLKVKDDIPFALVWRSRSTHCTLWLFCPEILILYHCLPFTHVLTFCWPIQTWWIHIRGSAWSKRPLLSSLKKLTDQRKVSKLLQLTYIFVNAGRKYLNLVKYFNFNEYWAQSTPVINNLTP